MSTDAAYTSFLEKANEDPASANKTSTVKKSDDGGKEPQLVTTKSSPPSALTAVEAYYTSDADEPFEVVSLAFQTSSTKKQKQKLDITSFAAVLGVQESAITALKVGEWDPKGQYADVVSAVARAAGLDGDGAVNVFRVEGEGARVVYWVVALRDGDGSDDDGAVVVGFRAKAVES